MLVQTSLLSDFTYFLVIILFDVPVPVISNLLSICVCVCVWLGCSGHGCLQSLFDGFLHVFPQEYSRKRGNMDITRHILRAISDEDLIGTPITFRVLCSYELSFIPFLRALNCSCNSDISVCIGNKKRKQFSKLSYKTVLQYNIICGMQCCIYENDNVHDNNTNCTVCTLK